MAGNISISAGVAPAQSRTSVSGGFSLPARPAPAPAPAGYQLVYQMGGPRYMYGETPRYGAYYSDGGTVPGQIYGNMRGSREGADMFGFFPTMFQSSPYATASQMYTPSLGVMPLIGYPSKYPHVIMGGYTDYGAPIANQAINMMLPLLMMGLYRQMFPMMPQAPAVAKGAGGGGGGGKSGGKSGGAPAAPDKPAYSLLPPSDIPFVGPPPPEVRRASSPSDVLQHAPGFDVRRSDGTVLMDNAQYRRAAAEATVPLPSRSFTPGGYTSTPVDTRITRAERRAAPSGGAGGSWGGDEPMAKDAPLTLSPTVRAIPIIGPAADAGVELYNKFMR